MYVYRFTLFPVILYYARISYLRLLHRSSVSSLILVHYIKLADFACINLCKNQGREQSQRTYNIRSYTEITPVSRPLLHSRENVTKPRAPRQQPSRLLRLSNIPSCLMSLFIAQFMRR